MSRDVASVIMVVVVTVFVCATFAWTTWIDRQRPQLVVAPSEVCGRAFEACITKPSQSVSACTNALRTGGICPGSWTPLAGDAP